MANIIVLEPTLSFLGLGVKPNVVTWGRMLNGGRLYLNTAWWLTALRPLMIQTASTSKTRRVDFGGCGPPLSV